MGVQINLLDLFSGIGGFHLGLERAGFKVNSYNSEIDKYAIQVYKHNFKDSKYVGSVTDVRGSELPRINGITFGSPCQDFSLAGRRKGMSGERSSLILEAIRLIKECRPDFFIWENVKGTFSSNNRQDFAAILQTFTNIGGYRLEWQLLNTKWFLPQNRERVYLVGYLGDGSRGEVFPIGKSNKEVDELQRQQANTCTLTTRYEATGNGSYITERKQYAQEIQTLDTGCEQAVIGAVRGRNPDNPSDRSKGAPLKQTLEINNEGVSNTLTRVQKDNYVVSGTLRTHKDGRGFRQIKDGDSPCIPARAREDGSGQPIIGIENTIRRLTPLECERLQGFPDNWTQYGIEGPISDTQRYKMCGNAVTVDVVEAVAKKIKDVVYG
jgi:DNA (cytosine-5)-methyltransferase 1